MAEILPINDKTTLIPKKWLNPRDTDKAFSEAPDGVTIFLADGVELDMSQGGPGLVTGAHYRDSLMSRVGATGTEYHKALHKAKNKSSARFFEEFLREKYKDPSIILVHITSGIDKRIMNPVRWFGFFRDPQAKV